MSKSGHEAVANDKDGACSLVDPQVLSMIHLQVLENGQYFETDLTNGDIRCAKASALYISLCKHVENLEQEPELARELSRSLFAQGAAVEVQLVTSCKSHKPPGASKFRNIHSAPPCISKSHNVVGKTAKKAIAAVPNVVQRHSRSHPKHLSPQSVA